MTHKKKLSVILAMAVLVIAGIAAHKPQLQPGDGFKNLQVLPKDISHDSLMGLMHQYSHALGVHCTFCHAPNKDDPSGHLDFASDDKPEKDIARHMMRMTAYINTTYFNFNGSNQPDTIKVVSCVTCHRGNPHPESEQMGNDEHRDSPPPPGMPPPPPGNSPAPNGGH